MGALVTLKDDTYTVTATGTSAALLFEGQHDPAFYRLDDVELYFINPSATDTQTSLQDLADQLRGVYRLQNALVTNGHQNDCSVFDKHGFCVGLSGGYVATGGANTKPVTVTAAYRINQYARMGVFVGQDLNSKLPSNFGLSSKNPFVGAFAAVQQNVNGKGWNARASFGYHANVSVVRSIETDGSVNYRSDRLI